MIVCRRRAEWEGKAEFVLGREDAYIHPRSTPTPLPLKKPHESKSQRDIEKQRSLIVERKSVLPRGSPLTRTLDRRAYPPPYLPSPRTQVKNISIPLLQLLYNHLPFRSLCAKVSKLESRAYQPPHLPTLPLTQKPTPRSRLPPEHLLMTRRVRLQLGCCPV